ncbi:unnamed protein product [Gadus morhua 'NCC']
MELKCSLDFELKQQRYSPSTTLTAVTAYHHQSPLTFTSCLHPSECTEHGHLATPDVVSPLHLFLIQHGLSLTPSNQCVLNRAACQADKPSRLELTGCAAAWPSVVMKRNLCCDAEIEVGGADHSQRHEEKTTLGHRRSACEQQRPAGCRGYYSGRLAESAATTMAQGESQRILPVRTATGEQSWRRSRRGRSAIHRLGIAFSFRTLGTSLKAVLRDDFRQNPQDLVVVVGEPASLECQPPRGHPEPTVYWKKDKGRLDLKDDRLAVRGGKLTIASAKKTDAGTYVCVATNMVGEKESETAQLSVFERPVFVQRPVNQVVLVEESVEFRCQVQGDPPPTVRWRKEDVDLSRGRYDIRSEKEDSLLRIKRASASDQGTFTCTAENRVGKVEASAYLTIREAPQFVVRPRDQIVTQGRSAAFPCETKGKPQPTVFWQREGSQDLLFPNQPTQGDSRVSVSLSGEMTIRSVQRADAGYYTCQALTVAGSILAKALLEVADASKDRPPPIIRQGPSNQTQAVGGAAVLRCLASGDPEPTITWLKDRASLLGKDPRMALLDHGSLQIQDTQLSDAGLFTCVATSSTGETSWSAYLDVRESGDLVDFMSHNATALPGPPSKPEVTDVTKSSISLSWEPGPEAGTPVTSYVIEAFGQSVSNSWTTLADHVRTTQFTVRDLRPNTVYLFIIRAVNTQGLGDPSAMSEPVRTQDIRPTVQGVDHRRVQKELGEVLVSLHNPVVLSSTSVHITWTVENPSQFIQG